MTEEPEGVPEILYHYTSIEAFKRILESGTIRATRYDQMNDLSEVQLGVELLLRAVRTHKTDDSTRQYKEFLIARVDGYREVPLDVYVLSLSSAADSLGQWRAYAPKGGVAIGFDRRMVQEGFLRDIAPSGGGLEVENPTRPDPGNQLMQCAYTDKNGDLDLGPIVAQRFFKSNSFPAFYASGQPFGGESFNSLLSVMIYRTICSIKPGAYAYEKEWRCVNFRRRSEDYPVKLSETNRLYIEMQFDRKKFIKEVWISPHGDSDGYERGVAHLRRAYDLSFTLRRSTIPYRA